MRTTFGRTSDEAFGVARGYADEAVFDQRRFLTSVPSVACGAVGVATAADAVVSVLAKGVSEEAVPGVDGASIDETSGAIGGAGRGSTVGEATTGRPEEVGATLPPGADHQPETRVCSGVALPW